MNLIEHTPSAHQYPLIIKQLLQTAIARTPEQEIVYRDLQRYSYGALGERAGRLAGGLTRLGIEPGDTVGVMDWDSHRYLECYFAVPMMGAVLHTINIRLSQEEILYTINHAEDDVLLVHNDFLPILGAIKDRIKTVKKFVLLTDGGETVETSLRFTAEYEELLDAGAADYEFPDFDENSRATTFYTTATTGRPKGVCFSHRQVVLHTLTSLAALSMPAEQQRFHNADVYMPITPMFHVHAWGIPYVATVMGVKQVYPGRYSPDMLCSLVKKEKVTFSHCVPAILHMLLNSPRSREVDLSNWKVIVGGSALPKGLARAALDRGIDVFAGYGLSETCPILTLAQLTREMLDRDADAQIDIRTKTGLPIPMVDLRVVDDQMNDVAHDGKTTGEVVVRAPWLTQAYVQDPESSEKLWRGGYLHTGDIGHIDPEGYLRITDRIKDLIKTGGESVSSLEIENVISQVSGVNEVAVIGVKDEKWGERPLALVVLRPGFPGQVMESEIEAHLNDCAAKGMISKWAVPERIVFVETLAKTSVGKIDKKALRQQYERERSSD